ncbi:hypothetical protein ACMS04_002517 [Cronobacter malonaticus]
MSRYTGKEQADQILEAASEWRQLCLINGGSLFSNKNLWDSQHLAEIERDVVNSQLELEGNFMHRLKEQLASVSPEADLPPPLSNRTGQTPLHFSELPILRVFPCCVRYCSSALCCPSSPARTILQKANGWHRLAWLSAES